MALAATNLERASRLLWALEQRVQKLMQQVAVIGNGAFIAGDPLLLTEGQEAALNAAISDRVGNCEKVLATLEETVTGATAVKVNPAGPGIADRNLALDVVKVLAEEATGAGLRVGLIQELYQNPLVTRDDEGEFTLDSVTEAWLLDRQGAFEGRIARIKLALSQLRALGA